MKLNIYHSITSFIESIFTKDIIYHIIFWVAFYFILVIGDQSDTSLPFKLGLELVNVLFYVLIVYFNLLYLIPRYLNPKKNLLWYLLLLSIVCLLITPIKTLIYYFILTGEPLYQELWLRNQSYILLTTFFVAGSSTIYKIFSDWQKHQREKVVLQKQSLQSELRFLKSQINPHFLFNTLNSLYALTLKKSDDAPEIVLKLSEMMRYMLYECNERRVPLEKEVNYIRNYLDLEQLRHGEKFDIKFKVNGEVDNQKIAPLMFIPFLENSFKHGIAKQLHEGFVNIDLEVNDFDVNMTIENSKNQTKPALNHRKVSGGIGLVNIRRRLDLLYSEKYELDISETPNTYKVVLNINLAS
jgi:sensor histidine kinase YesM